MAKTGAIFSEGDAGRISRVVKKVEAQAGGEGGKRRRRVAGQATTLWAKLTSAFNSGLPNTVKANPCDGGGENTVSEIELVFYAALPTTGTPDRSCLSAGDVVAYVPYVFRDAEGNKTADGFLVSGMRATPTVERGKIVTTVVCPTTLEVDPCDKEGNDISGMSNVTVDVGTISDRLATGIFYAGEIVSFIRTPSYDETVVDNTDGGCAFFGTWTVSTYAPDYYGSNYQHDGNTNPKGVKTATYSPTLTADGRYKVYMWWPPSPSVWDNNVPVAITHTGGTDTVYVDQSTGGAAWSYLGTYDLTTGVGSVQIQTTGTSKHVCADAVRFVREDDEALNGVLVGTFQDRIEFGKPVAPFTSGFFLILDLCTAAGVHVEGSHPRVLLGAILGRTVNEPLATTDILAFKRFGQLETVGGQSGIQGIVVGITQGLPTGTINARLGHDGDAWQALRAGLAKIVSNDGSGDYTISEQIWDPDLGTPAWVDFSVTVTGDGGPTSPNGEYPYASIYSGYFSYTRTDSAFSVWTFNGTNWVLSVAPDDAVDGSWRRAPTLVGTYADVGAYTGDPVLAITTLSARDISQNANGAAGDFVFFWQQLDDNGDTETVCLVIGDQKWIDQTGSHIGPDDGTVYSPDDECNTIYAFDLRGHCLGWWGIGSEIWESPWGVSDPGYPA